MVLLPATRSVASFWLVGIATLLAACSPRTDVGPLVLSAIGKEPALRDPASGGLDPSARVLLDATAQGLVRFDATGQIEPGIAERWSVIDNGTSYIFRLREGEWPDGRTVTAGDVVRVLRRQIAPRSDNVLAPFLTAIDEIVEMTPEVIEIRLKRPRPDLLKLFAQPELAVFRVAPAGGSGPYRIVAQRGPVVRLRPAFDPSRATDDDAPEPSADASVKLIGERAALAIARFQANLSTAVLGGSFTDWPIVLETQIAPISRRFDPAVGLFGLAVTRRDGVLSTAVNRAAIARTIDRAGFTAAISPEWEATTQLLPEQLDSAASPALAPWTQPLAPGERTPRATIDAWRAANPEDIRLSIALPPGPGATILYGYVAGALASLGIAAERVAQDAPADLRLVDEVAPYDSARWYVARACQPCGGVAQLAIEAARNADSPRLRAQQIAAADSALASDIAFIPIARPLRWSLVAPGLRAWAANTRAWHPLNHLRADPN